MDQPQNELRQIQDILDGETYHYRLDGTRKGGIRQEWDVYEVVHPGTLQILMDDSNKMMIHHNDGDPTNNRPYNLQLMELSEHRKLKKPNKFKRLPRLSKKQKDHIREGMAKGAMEKQSRKAIGDESYEKRKKFVATHSKFTVRELAEYAGISEYTAWDHMRSQKGFKVTKIGRQNIYERRNNET